MVESPENQLSFLRGSKKASDLNILVYETDGNKEIIAKKSNSERKESEIHPDLRLLQSSESLPGVKVSQVGENSPFSGFSTKWSWVMQELKHIPDEAIVVVCDNRDVLLNIKKGSDNTAPVEAFKQYVSKMTSDKEGAILISAEKGCCVGALTFSKPGDFFNDKGERTGRSCSSGAPECQWKYVTHARAGNDEYNDADLDAYKMPWVSFQEAIARERLSSEKSSLPEGATTMKNMILNMGLVTGKKKDIVAFIKALDLKHDEDDQAVATDYFYRFPEKIVLDYIGKGFGNNDWQTKEGCKFTKMDEDRQQIAHEDLGITPLFLHYPGFTSNPNHTECMYNAAALLGHDPTELN